MPVKILLADKSITIQKVVEMLFSGKEYEVTCVSDGEAAISDASRIVPDVVLADVGLPRLDGYGLAARMKQTAALSQTPVILMMSRDDQYNENRGAAAGIVDHIAKPFESQELIGRVKKALATAVSRPAAVQPAAPKQMPVAQAQPAARPPLSQQPRPSEPLQASPVPPKPKAGVPSDIFGIIAEAPASPAPAAAAKMQPAAEEEVFEVEPEIIEVKPEMIEAEPEIEVLPEMGIAPAEEASGAPVPQQPEAQLQQEASGAAEAFDTEQLFGEEPPIQQPVTPPIPAKVEERDVRAEAVAKEPAPAFGTVPFMPPEMEKALPVGQKAVDEMRQGLGLEEQAKAAETPAATPMQPGFVSFESLDMASRVSHEEYSYDIPAVAEEAGKAGLPPADLPLARQSAQAAVSEDVLNAMSQEILAKIAREVLERVAWEVIPDLAERLIREEIERLKAGS